MKKIIIIMTLLVLLTQLFAVAQTEKTAELVAKNFMNNKNFNSKIIDCKVLSNEKSVQSYIFRTEPNGFVAVSADDDIYPVIAYSTKSNFDLNNNQKLRDMLELDMKLRKEYYLKNNSKANENRQAWIDFSNNNFSKDDNFQQWPMTGSTITDGWLKTSWNQSAPYNNYCPIDPSTGERAVVGCVATAMSMIVHYHEYINNATFNDNDSFYSGYSSPYIHVDNDSEEYDFPDFEELTAMMATATTNYNNGNPTIEDIGAVGFACGVTVEMSWSSDGSGSWTQEVPGALQDKFGYISGEWKEYGMYAALKEDMKNMRPAEMSIRHADGSSGHAINTDGYNTDDYYHLNFGWGTSNSTCWYLLPEGMPSNYAIITGVAVNMEGGEVPVSIEGNISLESGSPEDTRIVFEGEKYSFEAYANEIGQFEIPAILKGTYDAYAVKNGYLYDYKTIEIDGEMTDISFDLIDYSEFYGTITCEDGTNGAVIHIFEEDKFLAETTADENGDFEFSNILPGNYTVKASKIGKYYGEKDFEVSPENQEVSVELDYYDGDLAYSYAKNGSEMYSLNIANVAVGIKICDTESNMMNQDIITGVNFVAPFNSEEGDLSVQLWEADRLISDVPFTEFVKDEEISLEFENYIKIESEKEYFVGIDIKNNTTGDLMYVDEGPRVPGKGMYFKTTSWTEIPIGQCNANFTIQPIISSQNYGVISGNISIEEGNGDVENSNLKANYFFSEANTTGDYSINVKEGNYEVSCFLEDYPAHRITDIEVSADNETSNVDFDLTFTGSDDEVNSSTNLLGNFPNPYYSRSTGRESFGTSIKFSLESESHVAIDVFNIKGQKVKTLADEKFSAGENSVRWDTTNDDGESVGTGVYFYKFRNGKYSRTKKTLLIK